jgi:N12 class adenine-specific DNA methylase
MPSSYDPYRQSELDQRAAEEEIKAQRRLNAQQAKQAAKASEAMAKEDRKAELSRQELDMRAQGMIPVTTADGNLHPDPLWEQKQAEKAAKAAQEQQAAKISDQFALEGRKSFVSKVTGLPTALESDEQLAAQKQAKADAARKTAINERITALETAATDPAKKRLPTSARDKLAKQIDKTRQEALFGLQSTLQKQAKAVSGGDDYIPFNEAPTPEATAAQERLTRLSQPGADLTEEDLALLEANDATKPQAQKLRNIQALLAKDDEAAKFHDTQAASVFDLKLRRDDPAAWAAKVKERRAAMTPEQLKTDLESSSADLQARSQELQAKVAPIQQRRALSQQKLDTLSQQAAQRRQRGLMASEIVTFTRPDGSTEDWPADLAATYEREIAMAQQAETQEAATLEQLQALQADLQAEAALHDEGTATLGAKAQEQQQTAKSQFSNRLRFTPGMEQAAGEIEALQSDAETRKAVLDDMYPDGAPPEAIDALNADVQAKAEQAIATGQARLNAATAAYGGIQAQLKANPDLNATAGDLFIAARKKLAQDAGITEAEAKRLLDDAGQLDWDQVTADEMNQGLVAESWKSGKNMSQAEDSRKTRLLSNGAVIVHPNITDEKGYAAAVAASGATPDAQAEALARYPAIRAQQAKQTLETIQEVQSVLGPDSLTDWEDYADWKKKKPTDVDEAEWALRWSEANKAKNTGILGTLLSKTKQFIGNIAAGGNDLRQQASGILAGITGSETLMQDAQWAGRKAEAQGSRLALGGHTSDNFLTKGIFDQLPRLSTSLVPAVGGAKAAQAGIRLFAGTKLGARFLPSLAAALETAATPAQAVKAVSTLTRAGLGGAAAAGAGQTYGAQLADIYGTLRKENPELDHATALRQAQMPAIASGLATALLTVGFGSTGISRLITRPAEAKAAAAKVFTSQLQRMGFAAEAFVSGGIMETIEESLDEGISQVAAALGKGHPVQQAVGDFLRTLPEMAVATMIMGGAGEGISSFKESTVNNGKQPSTTVNPANLPETIATAESAIDALQIPNADEATLARTQDAARGVLYIAQGSPLTDLDADTLAALDIVADPKKPGSFINGRIVPNAKTGVPEVQEYKAGMAPVNNADGTTGTRAVRVKLIDGQPVISQPTLDNLEKLLPAVRAAIPQDEKSRLQKLAQPPGTPAGQAPAVDPVANANPSPVQAPADAGTQPTRSGNAPAQSGAPVAAAASSIQPPASSNDPAAQQRATELATLLETRGLTAPQAQLAAQKVIEAQGIVGTSAEEQYTAGIDTEMQALGWIRGTGKNYAFVPPEGSALNAKAPEAQPSTTVNTPQEPQPASTPAPVEDSTDPFAPAASSSIQNPASSNESDIANRLVVAKARAMKSVPVAARKRFLKFLTPLSNHLARFQNAFPGGVVFTDGKAKDDLNYTGAGIAVANSTTSPRLEVNLAELFKSADHLNERELGSFTRRAVMHEVRHLAALKVITPGQARALWKDLTPALQARVYASYFAVDIHIAINEAEGRVISSDPKKDTSRKITEKEALAIGDWKTNSDLTRTVRTPVNLKAADKLPKADPFHMAHEFLRMLDEDAEFAGQTSEAMDANPSLGKAILDFLRSVLDEIKRLIATDLDQSTRVQLREFQKLVEAARKKLLSDNPADRLGSTKAPAGAKTAQNDDIPMSWPADKQLVQAPTQDERPLEELFPEAALGKTITLTAPNGTKLKFRAAVVEALGGETIPSMDFQGRPRTDFPTELQPRTTEKSALSQQKRQEIAQNTDYSRLSSPAGGIRDGAPKLTRSKHVVIGNHRDVAIDEAYARPETHPNIVQYEKDLRADAANWGIDEGKLAGIKHPKLVFILEDNVDLPLLAQMGNAEMGAVDQAYQDAAALSGGLALLTPSEEGKLPGQTNGNFFRWFLSNLVHDFDQKGRFFDDAGELTQDGMERVQRALLAFAYGDSPQARRLINQMVASPEEENRNLARVLAAIAPTLADIKVRIADGALHDLDLSPDIVWAAYHFSRARKRGESIENALERPLTQEEGWQPATPLQESLLRFFDANARSARQTLDAFIRYNSAVLISGDPRQTSLFGDEKPDAQTLWKLAANYKEQTLAMGRKAVDKPSLLSDYYVDGKDALTKAHASQGGSAGLLRRAARSIADAGTYDTGSSAPTSSDDETDALTRFARQSGLMIHAEPVRAYMQANAMKGGNEHKVSHIIPAGRVLKDLDAHRLATESLYDYVTDLELTNLLTEDDISVEGFYQHLGRLHIITSQPFIKGVHPTWEALKSGLVEQGYIDPAPNSQSGSFVIPHPQLGPVDVIDLHTNNAIQRPNGKIVPIDVHFYFDDHVARKKALATIGLDQSTSQSLAKGTTSISKSPSLPVSESPPLPPKTALKLYRTLTAKAQENGTLTPPQAKALDRAEASLGQLFMFDTPNKTLKPAEDLVLERQTASRATFADSTPEQLKLFMATKTIHAPETPEETAALDAMFETAARVKPRLDALTRDIAAQFSGASPVIPDKLKGRERTLDKVRTEYAGDASKLKDLARTTIETKDLAQAKAVVLEIERRTGKRAKRNLFEENPVDGYRDALFNLVIDGHTVELQVHVPEILATKHHLHHAYVVRTGVERQAKREGREPTLDEWLKIDRMNRIMRRAYNTALGLDPDLGATPQELARRSAGTNSSASSGFTRNPFLALTSSSEIGRGGSSSNAQPLPAESRTTANASYRSESSGTSMNPVAPGNVDGFVTPEDTIDSPNKQVPRITTANISTYAGNVDTTALQGRQKDWKQAFDWQPGVPVVPLSKLVSPKNELEDPKFKAGLKKDPRQNAADWILKAMQGEPGAKKRAPLDVSANPDGTYTIHDGNATAQALMLAGWKAVPVNVIEAPTLAMGRKSVTDAGPDLFGFNAGLGLDTLLTPRQKEAKLQQSQQLNLFGGFTNDLDDGTRTNAGAKRPAKARQLSRPPADSPEPQGAEGLFGDLFSERDDGQRISATRLPRKPGPRDERTGSGDVSDGVLGATDQGPAGNRADSPQGDPPGLSLAPALIPQPADRADRNHRITGNVAPKGNKAKLEANFAAMKLVRELDAAGRNPTPEEKQILAAYTGWGWMKEAFNTVRARKYDDLKLRAERYIATKPRWDSRYFAKWQDYYAAGNATEEDQRILNWADTYLETHERLKSELSEKEFHAAEKSTLNAHFTTPSIIDAMWKAVAKLGFKGGRAMEPGGGIGHFIGVQPEDIANRTQWEATELDDVTARILARLYPQARVNSAMSAPNREVSGMGFQNARIPNNSLDLFISNVPFAKTGPGKAKSEFGQDFNLHNYFFARALAKVKPGGLIAFITTSNTMESSRAQRDYLNNHGQLVAAVRLPNNAFKENAGTEVTTDILILRKPDDSDFVGEPWRERIKVGEDTVTSKRQREGSNAQRIDDWLGSIDPEWVPADEALVEPFQAWMKGGRPASGQKRKALIDVLNRLHGFNPQKLDFRAPIYVNEYFARHPENVLGTNRLVGSMYGPGEYTVTPKDEPLDAQLDQFVDRLPEDIMSQTATNDFAAKAAERGDKVDSYVEREGKVYQVSKEGLEPVEWQVMPGMDAKTKAAAERKTGIFRQWAKLREAAVALVKLEANPLADEGEMKAARLMLNQVYDRTVEKHGALSKRRNNNYRFLDDDPEAALLQALEDEERSTDKDGKVTYTYAKTDIFHRRLIEPQEAPTTAATLEEAVSISMAWEGTVNPQYVADLLGTDAGLARQQLIEGGHVFEDPSSGMLMTADEYLSGPVSERLRLAQEAVKDSPQYARNVTALREALPPHKAISEASVILGQRWVPDSIYTAFARSLGIEDGTVEFSKELNSFSVRGEGSNEEWNVGNQGAKDILDAVVNNMTLVYRRYVRGEGMQTDEELTATLRVKADEMRDAFSQFVKTTEEQVADPEFEGQTISIPDLAEREFNQKVNGIKPPNFVGDWVKLPGQSGIIWLKPFRKAVLARLITQGRGMMAHGVGSGKTYNQIALAMELRRLGKARKPVIVVQNSTINQFAASFRKAYPQAKILVATPRSYNAQTRARFTARMATGDWDAIIMTHSNVDLIGHSAETVTAYFAKELEELDAAIMASDGSDQQSDLQKARDSLIEKRDEMMQALGERQDDTLNWEDIGVDALIVDEAHAFKNAPVVTNRGRDIKNIPSSGVGSQRAVSMMMKTRSVRERNGQKGVFFATGTPVSNSMAEAFIMLRYIAPDLLEANGIRNFDDFASQYGDVVSQAESTWDGKVKMVDRFAKFVNGQQLINLVRSVFDVAMGNESLGIDVPTVKGGKPRQIVVPATSANMSFNNWILQKVSPAWEAITRKDIKDNPKLSAVPIMTMQAGIAAALDPRLIHDNAPDDPNSKVNTAIREILRTYKAGTERKTAQVIFSDLFNSFNMDILEGFADHPFDFLGENPLRKNGKLRDDGSMPRGNFNLGADIKAKLIAAGVPEREIMVVTDQKDEALTNIFDKVNDGDIRVIIGSTGRLGVGVNIQERLAAVHHLMPPRDFKPAMMEQRNGRIIRQGNLHAEWRDIALVDVVERLGKTRFPTKDDKGKALSPSKRATAAKAWLAENDKDGSIKTAADTAAREFDIQIIEYGVEKSLDSAVYSMMAAKQGMIAQVLTADAVGNEFEDPSDEIRMNMAEMAAHTQGDPDMIRTVQVDKIFRELRAAYEGFQRMDSGRRSDVRRLTHNITTDTAALPRIDSEAERYGKIWEANEGKPVYTFGGTTINTAEKDTKITKPLDLWVTENAREMALKGQQERTAKFTINGQDFNLTIKGESEPNEFNDGGVYGFVEIAKSDRYANFQSGARGVLQALHRITESAETRPAETRTEIAKNSKKLAQIEAYLAKEQGFPRMEELQAIQRERLELQQRINARNAPAPKPPMPTTTGSSETDHVLVTMPDGKTMTASQVAAALKAPAGKLPEAPKRYRYEMRARPPGINTHPTEGLIAHTEGGNRHGYLDYNRRLTDEEVYNFELRPEEAEEPENRPERLAKGRTSVEPATNATILAMARKNPGLIESSMDDAADDTVRDAYEARHLADAEALDYRMPESMRHYSNAPTAQLRTLGLLFRAIAKQPKAFLLGPLTPAQQSAKTLDESLRAYNVPFLYTEEMSGRPATVIYLEPPADVPEEYQVPRYSFEIQAEKQPGTYSINSLMGAGKHATPLYQAIYTWAHNNGFQIVPDSGYTAAGAFRRISHMLSSALRHGTTKHFTPHTKQVPALAGLTGKPESFAEDIGLLSAIEADLTLAKAPFLSDIWDEYDLDRALHDSSSAATRRITAGLQATKVRLNQENSNAPLHVGTATAKRAFLAHHRLLSDTLRGDTGRQLSGVAGRQSEERRERESLLTNKVLYKGTTTVSQSPSPLAKLGWNHLDRAASAKLAAHTRWLTTPTHALVNRTAHNLAGNLVAMWTGSKDPQPFLTAAHALKREFFPDSVMPREVLAKKREMEIKTSMGSQRAMDLVRALAGNPKFSDLAYPKEFAENPMHRRNLYEAMTGERPMSSLPPELQTLATKLRAMLVDLGKEAVKQGRMSTDTFDNLRGTYMPHYYKEDVQKEKSLFHKFRLGVRDILAQRTTAWHITDTATKDANGEARLVSHSGNQWRFRNQEHMNAFFEDFITQQSLTELQSRYGKKFKNLTAADLMTPSKLDPEVRGRLQEIKRNLHQRYQRNRPLTVAEQEKAGLIMDPVYAIARYAAQMTHDNSTAEWFNFVAADPKNISDIATPGYTEIPDNPRFGRLAGKWVQDDIASQVLEMIEAPNIALQIYDTTLGWWKAGKTVLNPGTHVRNVLGNLFFSQLAGNSVWNPGNVPFYRQALQALRQGGPVLAEAYDSGVLGADFVSAELRQTLRQLLPDPATIVDDGKAPSLMMGIGKAIGKYVGNPANAGFNKITALYQAEDEIFKLAAYLKTKSMLQQQQTTVNGSAATPQQLQTLAAEHVRKWFPYFDSGTSGTLKLIGRTAMPFLGFYRESIRIFGHALKERPLALAAGLSVPSIVTMLSAMALGLDDDDLDEVKKDMRGRAGKLLGPTPLGDRPLFSMLLPFRSDTGQIQQFDISAVHPFVDFLGNRVEGGQKDGWWPQMFRSFVSAGPLGNLIYSNMTGEDAFFGSTIVEPNMTTGEAAAARLSNAAKTLLPPLAPGGTGFNTLLNMGQRGTSKTLEVRSPAQAMLRTVGGLDVRNATPDLYRLADDWRKAKGYEVTEGMDYGSTTPASRARKALFSVLAQDEPNPAALKNILTALDKMGHPVRTEQDVNRLLFYRDPLKLIGGNKAKGITATDAQAQFRASLQGEARAAFEASLQEYQRIKQRAPLLVRQAASL